MKGDKHIFIENNIFHKEYTQQEFTFLKLLHGFTGLKIDPVMHNNKQYITMPEGHVISIDTIPKPKRSSLSHIITKNFPFMLEQIDYLQKLNIYYSDCLQWLLYDNKLYLIDFDIALTFDQKDSMHYNNYNLLTSFLAMFNINYQYIDESLYYLNLFQTEDIEWTLYNDKEIELYNNLNNSTMQKNHIYYTYNRRHIQINHIPTIHVYGEFGNMIITETILNPEVRKEWELIKIL